MAPVILAAGPHRSRVGAIVTSHILGHGATGHSAPGFDELSPDEKLEYVQALWESVSERPEDVPVPDWHRRVVSERLAAHRRGEATSRPWSEVREDLLTRLRNAR